ncbi:MAG: acyltransferase [Methylotenera sp.]|nr:acyltransferase [Methylotenera sp.]
MRLIKYVVNLVKRSPAPSFIVAIFLSLRWKCRVSLAARIFYPSNIVVGKGSRIGRCHIIANGTGLTIGCNVSISDNVILDVHHGSINLHDNVAIGPFVVMYGEGGVSIGDYTMIATHSTIVATSHVFESTRIPMKLQGTIAKGIAIADDVWIGAHAVIQDGISIDTGAIIGSGSIVTRSVPEYTIVAGVPAKVIRSRKDACAVEATVK